MGSGGGGGLAGWAGGGRVHEHFCYIPGRVENFFLRDLGGVGSKTFLHTQ